MSDANPRKVLIGSDFSEIASQAIDEATMLARRLGAHVEIVHVSVRDDTAATPRWSPLDDWLNADTESRSFVLREGFAWLELIRRAQETDALLLVVGSHGQAGRNPLKLGSTVAKLALAAPCPVLVVNGRQSADR